MTPVERVRSLVQAGKVAPEEGERLIAALAQQPRRSPVWLLINPFDRFGGGVAATLGVLVCVLSLWTTRLGLHFDGFLDLHASRRTCRLWQSPSWSKRWDGFCRHSSSGGTPGSLRVTLASLTSSHGGTLARTASAGRTASRVSVTRVRSRTHPVDTGTSCPIADRPHVHRLVFHAPLPGLQECLRVERGQTRRRICRDRRSCRGRIEGCPGIRPFVEGVSWSVTSERLPVARVYDS